LDRLLAHRCDLDLTKKVSASGVVALDGTRDGLERPGYYLGPSAARERVRDTVPCHDEGAQNRRGWKS
jgi:hypothetical protein